MATLAVAATIGLATGGAVAARGPATTHPPAAVVPRTTSTTIRAVPSPASVPDIAWLAQRGDGRWVYGRGDHGIVRRLPPDETGLAIDERFVATTLAGPGGRSIVRIRDRERGRTIADVAAPIWVSAGAWTRAGLVVTGYGDASMAADGGLWLITATGSVAELVAAGPFAEALGRPVARGEVLVSPGGSLVASNACGVDRCDLQVVDIDARTVSRPVRGGEGFLRALTDDAVVTTDGAYHWIVARRIADGSEIWRERETALIDPVTGSDGSVVGLVGSSRSGWAVATIDGRGAVRDLTTRSRGDRSLPRIWRTVSNATAIVVGRTTFEEAFDRGGPAQVTILSPGRGAPAATTIVLPATTEAVP